MDVFQRFIDQSAALQLLIVARTTRTWSNLSY